jgi:glycosyltransferase involved in cell wall biosynthesis
MSPTPTQAAENSLSRETPLDRRQHASPIRVCHVISTTEYIAWPVNQLTRLRDDYGYEVTVDRMKAAGIQCIAADFTFPSLPAVVDGVAKAMALARIFRRERFDIVQTALWHSMILGRFAAWLADVPVRLTMHAGPYYLDAPIHRWIDGSTTWMETFIIGCCRYINQCYRELGVKDDRIELVYYGPDETRFNPAQTPPSRIREEYGWPDDTPLIAHIAYFYARVSDSRWTPPLARGRGFKGHEELIRSAPTILREFPNAKILLIGQGFLEPGRQFMAEMRALVAELGLEESVIFTGFRKTVDDVLMAADVAVQPSLSEGCGGTVESLLMERPTVGTRIGGIPDMVIDGVTGVLVNPADPEDLARGICSLLRDPAWGAALGRAGRQHVLRTASLTKTVADLDEIYRERLLPNGRRRTGYRPWVPVLRRPVLMLILWFLNWRLRAIEPQIMPMWEAGWRPWQPQQFLMTLSAIADLLVGQVVRSVQFTITVRRQQAVSAFYRRFGLRRHVAGEISRPAAIRERVQRTVRPRYQQAVSAFYRRFGLGRNVARLACERVAAEIDATDS